MTFSPFAKRYFMLRRTAEDSAIIARFFRRRLRPLGYSQAYMRATCDYTEFPPHPYPISAWDKITRVFDSYPP